jgi:hypothetical protein
MHQISKDRPKAGVMAKDLEKILIGAQQRLNDALEDYESDTSTLAHDFKELKVQATIFQYEICVEMTGIQRNRPTGFALSVALKGMVHRLFEYDQLLSKKLINKIQKIAEVRGLSVDKGEIRAMRKRWGSEFEKLQKWSDIRNKATGHYDGDILRQIELTKSIDFQEIMSVATAFLRYNMEILLLLKRVGEGS